MHKNKYKIMVEPLIPRSAVYLICLYTYQIAEGFFVRNSYFVWTIHGVANFQRLFRILPKVRSKSLSDSVIMPTIQEWVYLHLIKHCMVQ